MTDEMKPVRCGCGGKAVIYVTHWWGKCYVCECEECGTASRPCTTEAEAVEAWNRSMGVERGLDEWCTDCKEYDQEKQCCHRWNRVIKKVVDEVREKYDERTAKAKVNFKDENYFFG